MTTDIPPVPCGKRAECLDYQRLYPILFSIKAKPENNDTDFSGFSGVAYGPIA